MLIQTNHITGAILAGGLSRRMGGGDKGLIELAGRPMIAHVIERLTPQCSRLVLNANGEPERFATLGLPVAADTVGGFVGPLAGVLAGMRWSVAFAPKSTHILTASADAPLVPRDLALRLAEGLAGKPDACIALAASGGHLHPVIGLWPVALADDLEAALGEGLRKVLAWTDRHGTVAVEFAFLEAAGERVDPFFNANTPEELAEARRLVTLADGGSL